MTSRTLAGGLVVAGLCLMPCEARAQSRESQMQILADMRILQEQVQSLRLAVGLLAEQTKAVVAKIDSQAEVARTQAANTLLKVQDLERVVNAIEERLNQNKLEVSRVNSEIQSIREGQSMLQQQMSQVLTQVLALSPIGGAAVEQGAAGQPPPAGALPPSPTAYWNQAMAQYSQGNYDLAIEAYQDVLAKFPTSTYAPEAQYQIGEAYLRLSKFTDALGAFSAVISKYPTSDQVPKAYVRQATCYVRLQRRQEGIDTYKLVVEKYPNSIESTIAKQELQKLGVIIR